MVAMIKTRRVTLAVALVLALGTGWLTLTYLSNLQRQANANSAPVSVVVASQEIPARVPITAAMLAVQTRPASAVDPNAITDMKSAVGSLSLITISPGEALNTSMVGRPEDVGLTVRLTPGMRAVTVPIDKVKGIAGLIQPGDMVDVIAQPPKSGNAPPPASTILRGIRVLAIGDSLEETSATPSPEESMSTTATLEVTPKQADLLVMADLNATLRLALRSPKEPLNSEPTEALHWGAGPDQPSGPYSPPGLADAALLKDLSGASQPVRPDPAPAAPARQAAGSVPIIDGDHYTGGD
jgi:pilus assembly protein CpaB